MKTQPNRTDTQRRTRRAQCRAQWSVGAVLAATCAFASVPAGAADAPVKPFAVSGLTGMWTLNQADFDKRETPPYTPAALALDKQRKAEVEGGRVISDEGLKCLPHGMPSMMLTEFALEILETPQRVTIISEASPLVRSVYLNRTKPTEGLEPMWNGYSVGHWEGKTLVIKTTDFNDKMFPLGFGGAVHSSTTSLTERLSVAADGKTMVDELTMEDPRYLLKPFTLLRHFTRLPADAELWEYACEVGGKGWSDRFLGDTQGAKDKPSN